MVFRRRRRVALGVAGGLALLLLWAVVSLFGGGGGDATADRVAPNELPRGGRTILPRYRVVAFYGAPQHEELGVLGIGTPEQAATKLLAQARPYGKAQPVLPAFELIATIAHSAPGQDGMYRERQSAAVIGRYLEAVRRFKGILILDIQPGRADFMEEVRALEPYLRQPDVSLALDPEWSVPAGVEPGQEIGSTSAETVNEVSAYLSQLVQNQDLPQKLLLVHQFTEGMVVERRSIAARPGVAIVSNVDGFGTPELKAGVYKQLTAPDVLPSGNAGSYTGFKLFYSEDTGLMDPAAVLRLRPRPEWSFTSRAAYRRRRCSDRRSRPLDNGTMIVAIDGPAGSGKSTVARALARRLGFTYLDSGALYRTVTLLALEAGSDLDDERVARRGSRRTRRSSSANATSDYVQVIANGRDVSEEIRTPRVTGASSTVAAHPRVRAALLDKQRELIAAGNYVVEGRDIGTVVAPDAEVKLFLTADATERASRRAGELQRRGHRGTGRRGQGRDRAARPPRLDPLGGAAAHRRRRGHDRHHRPGGRGRRRAGAGARGASRASA